MVLEDFTMQGGSGYFFCFLSQVGSSQTRSSRVPRQSPSFELISLDQAVVKSIESCPNEDMRRKMYSCILVVGGGARFRGLQQYLRGKLALQVRGYWYILRSSTSAGTVVIFENFSDSLRLSLRPNGDHLGRQGHERRHDILARGGGAGVSRNGAGTLDSAGRVAQIRTEDAARKSALSLGLN